MVRHFIDICDLSKVDLVNIISRSCHFSKVSSVSFEFSGKVLAAVFQKPSLRTRVSFDLAINQLGGRCITLNQNEIHLGQSESINDTALILSSMVDVIALRCYAHDDIKSFAANSKVPVINALTDHSHPCQVISAVTTFIRHFSSEATDIAVLKDKKLLWVGDCHNVLTSYLHLCAIFNIDLTVCSPIELSQNHPTLKEYLEKYSNISYESDPKKAAKGKDVIMTDTWVSMGDANGEYKRSLLKNYQVNKELMNLTAKETIFSHCLPAHRGDEVTDEIIDSKCSVVVEEAVNRINAQKAILLWCFDKL